MNILQYSFCSLQIFGSLSFFVVCFLICFCCHKQCCHEYCCACLLQAFENFCRSNDAKSPVCVYSTYFPKWTTSSPVRDSLCTTQPHSFLLQRQYMVLPRSVLSEFRQSFRKFILSYYNVPKDKNQIFHIA